MNHLIGYLPGRKQVADNSDTQEFCLHDIQQKNSHPFYNDFHEPTADSELLPDTEKPSWNQ